MHQQQQNIIDYYQHTEQDYKTIWHHKLTGPPAIHFGYYDTKATKHADALKRANEVMANWANIQPNEKVLDAGCGLGQSTIWLAQQRGAIATGISLVQQQIDGATLYAKQWQVSNATFIQGNYLQTPFANNHFDVVWCMEALCHAEDKVQFYKEAFRILKPGGRLIIAEYCREARPMQPFKEKLLQKAFTGWAIVDLDTQNEHLQHAQQCGFVNVQIKNVSSHVMQSYKNLREHTSRLLWLAYIIYAFNIINKVRFQNVKASHWQSVALEKKAFQYVHILAYKPIE